jgi:hypothetical protein
VIIRKTIIPKITKNIRIKIGGAPPKNPFPNNIQTPLYILLRKRMPFVSKFSKAKNL